MSQENETCDLLFSQQQKLNFSSVKFLTIEDILRCKFIAIKGNSIFRNAADIERPELQTETTCSKELRKFRAKKICLQMYKAAVPSRSNKKTFSVLPVHFCFPI